MDGCSDFCESCGDCLDCYYHEWCEKCRKCDHICDCDREEVWKRQEMKQEAKKK